MSSFIPIAPLIRRAPEGQVLPKIRVVEDGGMEEGVEVLIAATICEVSDHVPHGIVIGSDHVVEAIVSAHHWKLLLLQSHKRQQQVRGGGPSSLTSGSSNRSEEEVRGTGTRGLCIRGAELRESCPFYRPLQRDLLPAHFCVCLRSVREKGETPFSRLQNTDFGVFITQDSGFRRPWMTSWYSASVGACHQNEIAILQH